MQSSNTMILKTTGNLSCGTRTSATKQPKFRPFQVKQWDFFLQQARTFRLKHGHCMISKKTNASPELVMWAKRQRSQYRDYIKSTKRMYHRPGKNKCQMTPERIAVLNEIGFCWKPHEMIWEERFQELKEFGREYGHLNVPIGRRGLPHLANWVNAQRRQYKLMKDQKNKGMTDDRIRRLEEIGFIWIKEKAVQRVKF